MTELQLNHQSNVKEILDKINELSGQKALEYQREGNPFHNFEAGGKQSGKDPLEVLNGFKLKHDVSYKDICNDFMTDKPVNIEQLKEKTVDIIIYHILAYSLIKENI